MFIGIIIGIAIFCGLVSVFGGVLKKIMEVVSLCAKLCIGGVVAMLVYNIKFRSHEPEDLLVNRVAAAAAEAGSKPAEESIPVEENVQNNGEEDAHGSEN